MNKTTAALAIKLGYLQHEDPDKSHWFQLPAIYRSDLWVDLSVTGDQVDMIAKTALRALSAERNKLLTARDSRIREDMMRAAANSKTIQDFTSLNNKLNSQKHEVITYLLDCAKNKTVPTIDYLTKLIEDE